MTSINGQGPKPLSVLLIGWSSIIVSSVMIIGEIYSFFSSPSLEQMGLSPAIVAGYFPEAARIVDDLNRSLKIWITVDIVFFIFVLVGSIQFLRLRQWGRRALEAACWIGVVVALAGAVQDYWYLKQIEAMMAKLLSRVGFHQSIVNPLGLVAIFLALIFWLLICFAMIFLLRRPTVRKAVNLK